MKYDSKTPAAIGAGDQRIARVTLRRCIQRHRGGPWRVRRGTFLEWNGYILEIVTTAGVTGRGYIDAMPEFSDGWGIHREAVRMLADVVAGRDPFDLEALLRDFEIALERHRFVKAAFDTALHEIVARSLRQPLYALLGAARSRPVPATFFVTIRTPDEMADCAAQGIEAGYRHVKLKLEGDAVADVARVRAVRARIGESVRVSVDPNQGYRSAKDAIRALSRLESLGVDFAEQPIHYLDKKGLAEIRRATNIKIEADEAIQHLRDIHELGEMAAADTCNLRVNELGGIRNTIAAVRICEMHGLGYRFSAFGPQLTAAHALHLACAFAGTHAACDVGEYLQLLDDPFDGLTARDGKIELAPVAGIGVELRAEIKPEVTIDMSANAA